MSTERFDHGSRKHRRAGFGELHVTPRLVQYEPALGNGTLKTRLVFRRRALELKQERPVDLLDIDAAVLHRLESVGTLHELARGGLGVREGAGLDKLHALSVCAV